MVAAVEGRLRPLGPLGRTGRRLGLGVLGLVVLGGLLAGRGGGLSLYLVGRNLLWSAWGVGLLVLYLASLRGRRPEPRRRPIRPAGAVGWVVVGLVVLNGLAPYLGLKTRSSFDMYSNLRVEGAHPNHLLVRPADLAGYTSDLVEIRSSSDPVLDRHAEAGLLMTHFEFRSHLSRHPEASVAFLRGGELHRVERAGDVAELATPPSPALRRLVWFRPVDAGGSFRCQW